MWPGRPLHFAAMDNVEDRGTVDYLADTAVQAGRSVGTIDLRDIGLKGERFVDLGNAPMDVLFKLYPWEWLLSDPFGQSMAMSRVHMVEPAWKMMLSSKGTLPLLWRLAPDHPNLLPTFFEGEAGASALGASWVRKPVHSREGANITIVDHGAAADRTDGPYDGPAVLQAFHPLPSFGGMRPAVGSWIVGDRACGMGIREDATAITGKGEDVEADPSARVTRAHHDRTGACPTPQRPPRRRRADRSGATRAGRRHRRGGGRHLRGMREPARLRDGERRLRSGPGAGVRAVTRDAAIRRDPTCHGARADGRAIDGR